MAITAEQLIGAWDYVEYWVTTDDGEVSHPFGEDATGFIIYTPEGYMSLQVMRAGRPEYDSGDLHNGSEAEMAAAAAGYLAYCGPFSFDEATSTVRHQMTVSLYPNWIGQNQERFAELDGETLVLSAAPRLSQGVVSTPRIKWRRAAR